jgi:hypothetical protein
MSLTSLSFEMYICLFEAMSYFDHISGSKRPIFTNFGLVGKALAHRWFYVCLTLKWDFGLRQIKKVQKSSYHHTIYNLVKNASSISFVQRISL